MYIAVGRVPVVPNREATQQMLKGRVETMNHEHETSACPDYEALLEDSISGEIGGTDATRLSEHLKSCPGCCEARENVAPTPRLLHLVEATPEPGPGFARDVMARIRTDRDVRADRGFWQPFVSMGWRFA